MPLRAATPNVANPAKAKLANPFAIVLNRVIGAPTFRIEQGRVALR